MDSIWKSLSPPSFPSPPKKKKKSQEKFDELSLLPCSSEDLPDKGWKCPSPFSFSPECEETSDSDKILSFVSPFHEEDYYKDDNSLTVPKENQLTANLKDVIKRVQDLSKEPKKTLRQKNDLYEKMMKVNLEFAHMMFETCKASSGSVSDTVIELGDELFNLFQVFISKISNKIAPNKAEPDNKLNQPAEKVKDVIGLKKESDIKQALHKSKDNKLNQPDEKVKDVLDMKKEGDMKQALNKSKPAINQSDEEAKDFGDIKKESDIKQEEVKEATVKDKKLDMVNFETLFDGVDMMEFEIW